MRDLLQTLVDVRAAGRPVVCCRLVETRGSTPQKAGAMMLVFPDGSQAGTLGGGCVEAEVKRRALRALDEGQAVMSRFQLDSDYGWDDGLICGGRMTVLVDPLGGDAMRLGAGEPEAYYRRLLSVVDAGQSGTEAIVFDDAKSGLPAAACYLIDGHDRLVATLRTSVNASDKAADPIKCGDGSRSNEIPADDLPQRVRDHLTPIAQRPRPSTAGGVAYLPILPRCTLVIVGGGHVGQALGRLAADLDFDVWAVDDRHEYVSADRFPKAQRRIVGPIDEVLPNLDVTPDTYCVIVTRGHNHDEQALYHLADRGARYVGLIGSRRKIKMIFDDLLDEGVSPSALERVFAPLGIDIGSQTVMEIAVSIAAELVAHRNCGGVVPGRPLGVLVGEE